jgi:PST family polysaccharide transporter
MVLLLWKLSVWRPKFIFHWKKVKEVLGFSLNLTGFYFVNYFYLNIDNILIGKFLGSALLGFYDLAYRLLLFPLYHISSVIGRVMFPSLSIIQDDKVKVCHNYLKASRYIAVISFPLMMGLLITAPQFIRAVFGVQWQRSIFLVQILALVGFVQPLQASLGWIYNSQGRTDIQFRWGIFASAICAVSFFVGLRWNVEGVTVAYAITSFLITYPCFVIPFRLINLKFFRFVMELRPIFISALGMGAIALGIRLFLENIISSDLVTLILTVFIGITSYGIILFLFDIALFKEIFYLIKLLNPKKT